ncbi:MAG: ABC transporter permease [Deltaproteobacteria bacterium]|nr:ABC transporter permease [Deltaproteobacteria bacterium]
MNRHCILATLLRRELYRFTRLAGQTIAPPVITTVLFIVIFGYSLGGQIRELHGVPYIQYILPGLALMGVLTNAFSNSSTSLYAARFDRSIQNWVASPIAPYQFVIALLCGGVARGLVIGLVTVGVGVAAIGLPMQHPFIMLLWFLGVGVFFAGIGIVSGLMADSWDHLATISTFILTPLTYLGGTFYSLQLLPPFWRAVSYANPIFYCIDGFRFLLLGASDVPFRVSALVLAGGACTSATLAWWLIKRGYRLVR